jgi:hypothetical protein
MRSGGGGAGIGRFSGYVGGRRVETTGDIAGKGGADAVGMNATSPNPRADAGYGERGGSLGVMAGVAEPWNRQAGSACDSCEARTGITRPASRWKGGVEPDGTRCGTGARGRVATPQGALAQKMPRRD